MKVKRTERGWPGHFICASRCSFRRNTLLEFGRRRVVISTVGSMRMDDGKIETIGHERYYETMAFSAMREGPYWEADVQKQIQFEHSWAIAECNFKTDQAANDMHEIVVAELSKKMANGERLR